MKVGDYVRVLHGTEEGHITRFLENNYVEIETSDGFSIPVASRELVFISPEEQSRFVPVESGAEKIHAPELETGRMKPINEKDTYLGFVAEGDDLFLMYLNNSTHHEILYSLYSRKGVKAHSISAGQVSGGRLQLIAEIPAKDVFSRNTLTFQCIFHPNNISECPLPVHRELHPDRLLKKGAKIHLEALNKMGYKIDLLAIPESIEPGKLRESLMEGQKSSPEKTTYTTNEKKDRTIDLHIEALTGNPELLNNPEKLELQLNTFEKELDRAIVDNVKSIKFIHGVGNGTLRHKIHKKLSQSPDLLYFKDADKEKFGFGATTILLK